jgi:sigma-E factor negative regulatory protein RseA
MDQISALLDGELGETEAASLISRLKTDAQLRRAWDEYHRVGDALRGHVAPVLAPRVAARLADEPVVLAPGALRRSPQMQQVTRWALPALAASAAIAWVGWMALPTLLGSAPQVAQSTPAVTVSAPAAPVAPPLAAGPQVASSAQPVAPQGPASQATTLSGNAVADYLLAHQRFSPANAMQGMAPYARTVSTTGGDRR